VPPEVVFEQAELDRLHAELLSVQVPRPVLRRLELFCGSLDFCQRASPSFEHKSKDTLKLAGIRLGQVCNEDCPLNKRRHVCSQVETGVSVRAYMTLLAYAKALAWFRGNAAVEVEDLRQLAPFVLHEKLTPNRQSAFFAKGHEALLGDKVVWIRAMFDLALEQFEALRPDDRSPVEPLLEQARQGLEGLSAKEVAARLKTLEGVFRDYQRGGELSAPVYADLMILKSLYLRYQAYRDWLARSTG
jgi:hypothetical protein